MSDLYISVSYKFLSVSNLIQKMTKSLDTVLSSSKKRNARVLQDAGCKHAELLVSASFALRHVASLAKRVTPSAASCELSKVSPRNPALAVSSLRCALRSQYFKIIMLKYISLKLNFFIYFYFYRKF